MSSSFDTQMRQAFNCYIMAEDEMACSLGITKENMVHHKWPHYSSVSWKEFGGGGGGGGEGGGGGGTEQLFFNRQVFLQLYLSWLHILYYYMNDLEGNE